VHVGDAVREVHAGATVFIPANTAISISNIGSDALSIAFVFSAPGFEDFLRGASVHAGETNVPMSKAEDDELQRKRAHDVIYQGNVPPGG
jgi:oxalate decarboxylase/phosphoglucose isomerase-like protein (cupin superfamily)